MSTSVCGTAHHGPLWHHTGPHHSPHLSPTWSCPGPPSPWVPPGNTTALPPALRTRTETPHAEPRAAGPDAGLCAAVPGFRPAGPARRLGAESQRRAAAVSDPVGLATAPPSSSGDLGSPSRSPPGSLPWARRLHVTHAVLNGVLAEITSHRKMLSYYQFNQSVLQFP